MSVYMTIEGTPKYANGNQPPAVPPSDFDGWMNFLTNAKAAFVDANGNPVVDIWGIWNEPNSTQWWDGTKQQYYDLVHHARTALGDDVLIAAPDLADCAPGEHGCTQRPKDRLAELMSSDRADKFNIVSVHVKKNTPGEIESAMAELASVVPAGYDIYNTEGGHPDENVAPDPQRDHLDALFWQFHETSVAQWKLLIYYTYQFHGGHAIRGEISEDTVKELMGVKAPTPPVLQVVPDICQAYLHWEDRSGETHFEILRSFPGGGGLQTIDTVPKNVTFYNDQSAQCWTMYEYRVDAVNSVGRGTSNVVQITTF